MKKIRVFRATVIALIAGLLLCVSPGLVAAVDIPSGPPHAFYGNLLINGNPAPAGTKVEAKGTGVKPTAYNPINTSVAGKYGTPGAIGGKLIVQGSTLIESTILTFYVNNVSTGQTIAWHSGYKTKLDLAVTISAPTTPSGDGGGGGGGGNTLTTNLFGSKGTFTISSIGRVLETIVVTSPDGKLKITIPVNTIARDKLGHPLSSLTVDVDPDPSCLVPEDEHIIGLAYSFKPDGATFSPPIEIVFTYDPDELSEGVLEEELILAFCDEASGEWVQVAGDVNEDNNTITAHISHFTTYAIIGKGITIVVPPAPTPAPTPVPTPLPPKPTPAVFSPKSMIVSSAEVNPGETLTISVSVTNTGGEAGTHDVILKVAGVKESSKSISLNPGESKEVSFTISRDKPGTYQIECEGLSGSFVVKEAVVKPVTTPEVPAAPEVTEEGIQWWIWVIIAAVVLIGVGTGWYFYSRRVRT